MKVCGHCGEAKDASPGNFHRCATSKDGLHSLCKLCRLAYNGPKTRAWAKENRQKVRDNKAAWRTKKNKKRTALRTERRPVAELGPVHEVEGKFYCTTHGKRMPCDACAKVVH